MSAEKVTVAWIDDDPDRKEDAENLIIPDKMDVVSFGPQELLDKLTPQKPVADLFLVDYFLNQFKKAGEVPFQYKGLAVGNRIREVHPEHPIYAVSGKDELFQTQRFAAQNTFDRLFHLKDLQRDGKRILYHDALDYRRIRNTRIGTSSIQAVLQLLKGPESCKETLLEVLPEELHNGLTTQSTSLQLARWVMRELLALEGVVYSLEYAATHLGMTSDTFANPRISQIFLGAKYEGIFTNTFDSRWWVSELDRIVVEEARLKSLRGGNINVLAPKVCGIKADGLARCRVCKKPYPETMALEGSKSIPVHFRCSIRYPKKKKALFYDETRKPVYQS